MTKDSQILDDVRFSGDENSGMHMVVSRGSDAIGPGFPRWLLPIADKRSTKGVSERVLPYTGTIDHDLPLYWADLLMGNPASGHFVR